MTLNFPSSPTNGQTYSLANGATYTWDGEKWKASNIPDSSTAVQTSDNPSDGEFLKYDGTLGVNVWAADNNTTYSTVSTSAAGLAPTLPASHGGKFLRGDGTWVVPPDTDTTYSVGDGGLTQKNFTTTLKTKLDGIETSADVTDATNVAAAGAVMEGDTTTASMSFVVDEDNMSSNSNTKVPTQQSVKAYVDANAGGGSISNVVEDTSPQLGGNLDVLDKSITTSTGSNTDIVISPKGTGTVDVNSSKITNVTDPSSAQDAATKAYVDANAGVPASGGNFTGTVNFVNVTQPARIVWALNIDCSDGNYFRKNINANSTFTVSNVPSSGTAYSFTLELTHTSGTVTWWSGLEWPGGTAPTLTAGKTHLLVFVTDDGGTRWRGAALVDYTN